jgi:hypothetical protein
MSLQNSIQRLMGAIQDSRSEMAALTVAPWKEGCCVKFTGVGTMNPTATLYCKGKFVKPYKDLQVPSNAIACPDDASS